MQFLVTESGRLDSFLSDQNTTLSRNKIQAAIKNGEVTVNECIITKSSYQLSKNDIVNFQSSIDNFQSHSDIIAVNQHLTVLYEDDACMVLNKPAGIAVHPGNAMDSTEETLLSGIRFLFEERSIPFSEDSVLVHRLDKPTTGCIIVAKTNNSFSILQKQFEKRTTHKQYLAIVAGVPEHSKATIDAPIGRNLTDRTKMSVLKTALSREAITDYEVLDTVDDASLLLCTLHTGRTHQIRVHLSSIHHPLLGDLSYGSPASERISEQYAVEGLCLHAWNIGFVSPADHTSCRVEAPLPMTFLQALHATGLCLTAEN